MATITGNDERVALAPLRRQVEAERADLDAALAAVLDSGRFVLGRQVERFEEEFAAATGAPHAVGVASGTDAIELALRALGVGPDDEVVTQANTCIPTVAAIVRAGARPVLCDVEPEGATVDPASLAGAIGPRTRAVLPVHLYGQCADVAEIGSVVQGRGIAVVEDCAQAHGATLGDQSAGTLGALGCFSFYPTKNLAALGDAGAVVTGDDEMAGVVRTLSRYGAAADGRVVARGVNSRLDELQAAVLRVRLPRLEAANRRRSAIAERYDAALEGTPVRPLRRFTGRRHAHHLYVVNAPDRAGFRAALARRGVDTLVHYDQPVHGHPAYRELARGPVPLEQSEQLAASVVSLPVHPALNENEVELVASAAREAALEGSLDG
jgi:dTDP-4-amino-4,6-dideoxygalactose transaminase